MVSVGAVKAEYRGYGLVRDAGGMVKMDDPVNCPDIVWQALTSEDKEHVLREYWESLSLIEKEILIRSE